MRITGLLLATFGIFDASVALGSSADIADLRRAREKVPRNGWKGRDFSQMGKVLNKALHRQGFPLRSCESWSVEELKTLQRKLWSEAEDSLLEVYSAASDRRGRRFESLEALEKHWSQLDKAEQEVGTDAVKKARRDGMCHEAVMWWVHHLPLSVQKRLAKHDILSLPTLPTFRHKVGDASEDIHKEYEQQVSCQQCHTGKMDPGMDDAVLDPPLPVDKDHPGLERKRHCDFQYKPHCGPCDGLGGKRWGDGLDQFEPMRCEVVAKPEDVPEKNRTQGRYPNMGTVEISGEARWPLAVRKEEDGTYFPIDGTTLYLGWTDDMMRLRYDRGPGPAEGTEISLQSMEQAAKQDTGATVDVMGGQCTCQQSMAGDMHVKSFCKDDPFDPLKLPASEGGVDYLGRVRVTLDGGENGNNRTAIADHFMKWAFHFLVDAEVGSPSFGLPLRLYTTYGVRQVFQNWKMGDPEKEKPNIWAMPKDCKVEDAVCSMFPATPQSTSTEIVV
eukprot:TRINITY_DN5963_c0_g3_i1.p1 TRINITY_DN5963_c0_g3~~TRINITY_DN5963_c0_g3_i1.p1  ORF type:complete len:501 (+),score=102.06 TRINITY_DN5963_c0_g3_i1:82-1584(+)